MKRKWGPSCQVWNEVICRSPYSCRNCDVIMPCPKTPNSLHDTLFCLFNLSNSPYRVTKSSSTIVLTKQLHPNRRPQKSLFSLSIGDFCLHRRFVNVVRGPTSGVLFAQTDFSDRSEKGEEVVHFFGGEFEGEIFDEEDCMHGRESNL